MRDYARAAAALLAAFIDPYHHAVIARRSFTSVQPQSESSKAFYRSRAEKKRARRAARMNQLVSIGSIGAVVKQVAEPLPEPAKPARKSRTKKVTAGVDTVSA